MHMQPTCTMTLFRMRKSLDLACKNCQILHVICMRFTYIMTKFRMHNHWISHAKVSEFYMWLACKMHVNHTKINGNTMIVYVIRMQLRCKIDKLLHAMLRNYACKILPLCMWVACKAHVLTRARPRARSHTVLACLLLLLAHTVLVCLLLVLALYS